MQSQYEAARWEAGCLERDRQNRSRSIQFVIAVVSLILAATWLLN